MKLIVVALCLVGASLAFPADSNEWGQGGGKASTNCTCGWTNKDEGRIVGGRDAKVNEYPLIAGISNRGMRLIFCGGTIITPYHVLTAAHCKPASISGLVVVLAEHDITKKTNRRTEIGVKEMINHESYNAAGLDENDIALILVESKMPFNQYIGPACFPTKKHNLIGQKVRVIGWGVLWTRGEIPEVLQKVDLDVVPVSKCDQHFDGVNENHLCTFTPQKDSCQGDSGGPVIWLDPATNRYTIVGVVSYGGDCGSSTPGVNADVASYSDWILKKIDQTVPGAKTCQKQ